MRLTAQKITDQVASAMQHYEAKFSPFGELIGELTIFDRIWGSTACGFGGIGGAAMTQSTVIVIGDGHDAVVYINGRFAYWIEETTNQFRDDVKARKLKGAGNKSISEYGRKVHLS